MKLVFLWTHPANYTIIDKGKKEVLVGTTGKEKNRVSLALTISLSGKLLKTFVIAKGKGKKNSIKTMPKNMFISYYGGF